jgi:hypothetical protein
VDTAYADELLTSGKTLQEVAVLFPIHADNLSKKLRAVGVLIAALDAAGESPEGQRR